MMFQFMDWVVGPPQYVALFVLIQRGFEELHSKRNTRKLIQSGASEFGKEYYPVVAATHLGWIASIFFFIPGNAEVFWPAVLVFVLLQLLRYWTIGTLGQYWTHRIISRPDAPIEMRGPYAFVRHPNYLIAILETFVLPICFGAFTIAIIFGFIWYFVIRYKIVLEDRALASRRSSGDGTR